MLRTLTAMVLALAVPVLAFAEVQTQGTVVNVDKANNELVLRTDRGEETLLLVNSTRGLANAREGAKVIIKFTEKDGLPKVIEIILQESGRDQKAPPLDL